VARILDGKAIAAQVRADVGADVQRWLDAGNRPPHLAVVLVGDDPASASYVRGKTAAAAEVGILGDTLRYETSISHLNLLDIVHGLNKREDVDGILVQLPLPEQVDEAAIIEAVDPDKDVDGFHPINAGRLLIGQPAFAPATPAGIVEMLRRSDIPIRGRRVVIVGRSNIVGKPLASLLMQKGVDATVTVCHSRTADLPSVTREADVLVAAIGRPRFITADMVGDGAVVVDVGINRVDDASSPRGYRLVGDVDFDPVAEKASWITPVPGGVGPMTIAMLLRSTLTAAQQRRVST
jgi:methylenetetrahydrofolate dehydrogenase (NADP+) / methenyltetrahydrofolate cyclohydrolase